MGRSDSPPLEALATPEYWNTRYGKTETQSSSEDAEIQSYDWFRTYEKIKPFLEQYLPSVETTPRLLHLGCGNSTLTKDLHELGHSNQVNVDFSPVVIEAMKKKYSELMTQWLVMDVRSMEFAMQSFDVAIDKGTLDAMLHGSLWDPPEDVRDSVGRYVNEVERVLKPGGRWLYITYRQPHFLKPLLARPDSWQLEVINLATDPGEFDYFMFVMTKVSA